MFSNFSFPISLPEVKMAVTRILRQGNSLLKYTSGCLCTAQNVPVSPFAWFKHPSLGPGIQQGNRKRAKSRNRVPSAPCVFVIVSCPLFCDSLSLRSVCICSSYTYLRPWAWFLWGICSLERRTSHLGSKHKDEGGRAAACSARGGTATTDLASYFLQETLKPP